MSTPTTESKKKMGRPRGREKVVLTVTLVPEVDEFLREEALRKGLCIGDLLERLLLKK